MIADAPPPAVSEVVVEAARLPDAAGDAAFSIIQVPNAVLIASDRLDDALETVPGFSLYRRTSSLGANPTTQGVSLRGIAGSAASRALVTLDGVPQNDPFGGWVVFTALPTEEIAAATVVRGAGAGPYGSGALTGVIALDSLSKAPGGLAGEVDGGQLGYRRAAAVTSLATGSGELLLSASGEHSDGWIPVRYGEGAADRPLTLDDWSASAREQIQIGPGALVARAEAFQEDRGAGSLYAASRERGAQTSLTYAAQPTPDQLGWRLQGWLNVSDLDNSSASVAAGRQTATLANNQYTTPAAGEGMNAEVRRSTDVYSWELGVDGRNYDGESREHLYSQGVATGDRVSGGGEAVTGVYAEGSRNLGRWLLTGGARLDGWVNYSSLFVQNGTTPLDQHASDRGGAVPTGRVGLRRELFDTIYFRSAIYSGFRQATLNELHRTYRVGNNITEANAGLSPERLYGAEFGFGGTRLVTWDTTLFYNQLANAITNVTIGAGPKTYPLVGYLPAGGILYERENAGRINAYGFEGEADRRFGPGLDIRLAATLTHARVDGGSQAPQLTGLHPAETPEATLTATLSWQVLARLNLFADARYESARYDDDLNTLRIAPGTTFNARAEWKVTSAVNVYVAADNLFDANIQTGRSALNIVTYDAPRIARVGLTLRR